MNGGPISAPISERLVALVFRHPGRIKYALVEFVRPLPWRQRVFNSWWHLRHWNDLEAYCSLYQEAQDAS